jgi:hypothetical protein
MKSASGIGVLSLVALLALTVRAGYTQSLPGLLGTWEATEGALTITLTLNADGSGQLDGADISYVIKDGTLTVTESGVVSQYSFQLSGSRLTLSGGDLERAMAFERQGAAVATGVGPRRSQAVAQGIAPASPAGAWETAGPSNPIRMVLNSNGTGTFGGGPVRWKFSQGILSLTDPNGTSVIYNATLTHESMTVTGAGLNQPVIFRSVSREAAPLAAAKTGDKKGGSALIGKWRGPEGIVQINADGTLLIQGVLYRYSVQGDTITLLGNDGAVPVPIQLSGNNLTVSLSGQPVTLTRVTVDAPGAPLP